MPGKCFRLPDDLTHIAEIDAAGANGWSGEERRADGWGTVGWGGGAGRDRMGWNRMGWNGEGQGRLAFRDAMPWAISLDGLLGARVA